jgi:hypothetical protein
MEASELPPFGILTGITAQHLDPAHTYIFPWKKRMVEPLMKNPGGLRRVSGKFL